MKQRGSALKWSGKLLLHLPLYLVTSYVMRSLLVGTYRFLMKAEANQSPNLLMQHFLVVGLIDGFLAGLIGVAVVRAMLLLPTRLPVSNGPAWKRPQAWTWAVSICWFIFGIWSMAGARSNVLATPSGQWLFDDIAVFFGRGCDSSINSSGFQGCTAQFSFTLPWVGTTGYSAAAFIPAGWTSRLHNSADTAEDRDASDGAQQSEPGELLN